MGESERGVLLQGETSLGKIPLPVRDVRAIFSRVRKFLIEVCTASVARGKDQPSLGGDTMIRVAKAERYDPGVRRALDGAAQQVLRDSARKFLIREVKASVSLVPILAVPIHEMQRGRLEKGRRADVFPPAHTHDICPLGKVLRRLVPGCQGADGRWAPGKDSSDAGTRMGSKKERATEGSVVKMGRDDVVDSRHNRVP